MDNLHIEEEAYWRRTLELDSNIKRSYNPGKLLGLEECMSQGRSGKEEDHACT